MMEPASSSSSSEDDDDSSASSSSSSSSIENESNDKVEEFEDLPSDDSVSLSSDDDDDDDDNDDGDSDSDDDDEEEEMDNDDDKDIPLSERIYKQQHETGRQKQQQQRKSNEEKKKKALSIASQKLKQMKSSKNNNNNNNTLQKDNSTQKKKKSKHAPTEASSLRRDYFSNTNRTNLNSSGVGVEIGAGMYKARDPRMKDELSGHFDVHDFEKRYSFLEQVQDEEIETLKERIKVQKMGGRRGQKQRRKLKEKDGANSKHWTTLEEDEQELKRLLQERSTRHKSQIQRAARQSIKKKLRDNVASGKSAPYFPKKREWKQMEMEAKFEELRKRGGDRAVEKVVKKKRRKNLSKDSRFMPAK